jgi:hypothetical protein
MQPPLRMAPKAGSSAHASTLVTRMTSIASLVLGSAVLPHQLGVARATRCHTRPVRGVTRQACWVTLIGARPRTRKVGVTGRTTPAGVLRRYGMRGVAIGAPVSSQGLAKLRLGMARGAATCGGHVVGRMTIRTGPMSRALQRGYRLRLLSMTPRAGLLVRCGLVRRVATLAVPVSLGPRTCDNAMHSCMAPTTVLPAVLRSMPPVTTGTAAVDLRTVIRDASVATHTGLGDAVFMGMNPLLFCERSPRCRPQEPPFRLRMALAAGGRTVCLNIVTIPGSRMAHETQSP